MPSLFFYLFSALAVAGAVALVCFKNPVSSAMSMVASFVGFAALFIGLNAYFVGIIQVLVYTGAIMVLFLFIIMLLDLKSEERRTYKPSMIMAGLIIPLLFLVQLLGVLPKLSGGEHEALDLPESAHHFYDRQRDPDDQSEIYKSLRDNSLPDVNLVGLTMFGSRNSTGASGTPGYNFPLQIIGVLLLVATVGVVALSLKGKQAGSGTAPDQQNPD